jgi:hypothetical protein
MDRGGITPSAGHEANLGWSSHTSPNVRYKALRGEQYMFATVQDHEPELDFEHLMVTNGGIIADRDEVVADPDAVLSEGIVFADPVLAEQLWHDPDSIEPEVAICMDLVDFLNNWGYDPDNEVVLVSGSKSIFVVGTQPAGSL